MSHTPDPNPLTTNAPELSESHLVQLDSDHPGFRDAAYRERRNEIALRALSHRDGEPVQPISYREDELAVWKLVMETLAPLHARFACGEYLAGRKSIHLWPAAIPQQSDINASLIPTTGFRLSPAAGLVTPRHFLTALAERVFLSTQFVRHPSAPLYTPEPDVIHEMVGHAPLLARPIIAGLNHLFGEATKAADEATTEKLIRIYWYTLEFGLVKEAGDIKVVGAGLLSSAGELERFEREARLVPLDLEQIARTPFDPTAFQSDLFVAPSMDALVGELTHWLRAGLRA